MIYFQKNLSYLRSQKKLTLNKIAFELGFTASQWNNYELGFSFPKFLDLIKISKYLNISETDLIHVDLELKNIIELNLLSKKNDDENSKLELIKIQQKLIGIQEEKIENLKLEIIKLTS